MNANWDLDTLRSEVKRLTIELTLRKQHEHALFLSVVKNHTLANDAVKEVERLRAEKKGGGNELQVISSLV
jgi:hypothetical protein